MKQKTLANRLHNCGCLFEFTNSGFVIIFYMGQKIILSYRLACKFANKLYRRKYRQLGLISNT